MDWSNERYTRWYIRETVADAALSWQARAIWGELIKRLDRAGVLSLDGCGLRGLAGLLRQPVDMVEEHFPALLEDGRVELHGDTIVAPNYIDANEAVQSDKQRQAESRARRRDMALAKEVLESVTKRDGSSQNVTKCHAESHAVTNGHSVPSRTVPSRTDGVELLARGAIDHLNSKLGTKSRVGKSVLANVRVLAKDYSLEDFTAVIDAKISEWRGDPEMAKYLRPSTLFRPAKFRGYVDDLGSSKPQASIAFPIDEPEPDTGEL